MAKDICLSDEEAMRSMIRWNLFRWLMAAVMACCLGATSARAVGPEVRDSAGLFSANAVKQADETIRNIQKNFQKDLLVETFAAVPDTQTNDYTRNREEFFTSFVRERAQAARLNGIYVLVMKEPPPHRFRIQVGVGQATRQRAFTTVNRDELVRVFQASFREDKYDDGLRNAVGYVERTLRSNLSGQSSTAPRPAVQGGAPRQAAPAVSYPARNTGSSIGSLFILGIFIIGAVLVVIFLIRILRSGMGGNRMGGGGTGGFGGGGGGFFSSLLGGIGGAMAGSWLYDRLSGNAHASDNFGSNPSDAPPSDVGGDYSSSGGDVGGGSFDSGSDFGSSGGDVGGGSDFGGGGGDFGGGGGGGDA